MTANDNSSSVVRRSSGSQKRRRNRHIDVCCDEAEFIVIVGTARVAGMSLASYARSVLLGTPGPRARRAPHVNAEALARATAALNKVGSNLNQIAQALNGGGARIAAHECVDTLAETRAAVCRILEIVGRKERL